MYFLDLADPAINSFKQAWGRVGDSIVVVGGDGLWNCHIHTNDIGAALEAAIEVGGRPHRIRVTDLFEEVADHERAEHAGRDAELAAPPEPLPPVVTAVVAVASGPGLVDLFRQLGVQVVVVGGQTLNPSTAELLAAVERCNSASVVVLPNNKNIIPVAEQLQELTPKRVIVVPTTSMPAALAALISYDAAAEADVNGAEMAAAAAAVRTGELTRAVRDSSSDAGPIRSGDWIGLVRGDGIVSAATDATVAARGLLGVLMAEGAELITIITGDEAEPTGLAELIAWLAAQDRAPEVEVHHGGQPLYPYLFGVE
jgi:uncharacterized protein